jgi:hypothetical protein
LIAGAKHSKTKLLSAIDKDLESNRVGILINNSTAKKYFNFFLLYRENAYTKNLPYIYANGQGCERAYMVSIFLLLH